MQEDNLENILNCYELPGIRSVDLIENQRNRIYKLCTDKCNYALKVHNFSKSFIRSLNFDVFDEYFFSKEALLSRMKLMEDIHFSQKNFILNSYPVPIKNIYGSYVTTLETDKFATMQTWINGKNAETYNFTGKDAEFIGMILGNLHELNSTSVSYSINYQKKLKLFSQRILYGYSNNIFTKKILDLSLEAIEETRKRLLEMEERKINKTIVHGDFYSYNLIRTETSFIPIDFEYSSKGYYYEDLASICNEFDDNIEFKFKLIKSYENIRKLIVIPRYVETFQVFMTLLYLAANNNRPDNYEDWVKNFYK